MERTYSFGYWLRRRRKALGLTQWDQHPEVMSDALALARLAGVTASQRQPEQAAQLLELSRPV